jgi:hypothetical protein
VGIAEQADARVRVNTSILDPGTSTHEQSRLTTAGGRFDNGEQWRRKTDMYSAKYGLQGAPGKYTVRKWRTHHYHFSCQCWSQAAQLSQRIPATRK